MTTNGSKLQEWLTPALLAAGLTVLVFIWAEVRGVDDKLGTALIKLEKHETILQMRGLMEPSP
jgi:hypothetical protein